MSEDTLRTDADEISRDAAFRLLSHVYRRTLIDRLDRCVGPLSIDEATRDVARACTDEPIADVPKAELEQIRLSLYHSHVPKLADAGVVAYDRDADSVTLTERGVELADISDRLTDGEDRFSEGG